MKQAELPSTTDFSLVLGGPLYQLLRRARLTGTALELLRRRILVLTLVTWLPLMLLSLIEGRALGSHLAIPFLYDLEAQVRWLLALPVLIAAELLVHVRVRDATGKFMERNIVSGDELPKYYAAIESTMRLRNSMLLEATLVILVFTAGQWVWRTQVTSADSWYAAIDNGALRLTMAGQWAALVSVPIFQFILLRWYLRLALWYRFLWKVSKLNLNLFATHPDRSGGLAFLGNGVYAFGPILFAQGAMLSGLIATRVLHRGESVLAFKVDAASLIVFFVLITIGPLLMFTPRLARLKRHGLGVYGTLASQYSRDFENKWVSNGTPPNEGLLGNGDIQSLADLASSLSVIQQMRIVPFGLQDIGRLAAATAAPLLPLTLTVFSLEELVVRVARIVF